MKLLVYSHFFAPSIGGVETLVRSLATGLAGMRNNDGTAEFEITLVTQTPAANYEDRALPFRIIRQPSFGRLWSLIRASELVHVAGPALLPILFARLAHKPAVVEHHGFQTICPNGQLLIEPAASPCPGYFMAGRHGECLRCNSGSGSIFSLKLWLLTFLRRFLCKRAAANITPTQWLGSLLQLPRVLAIPHGLDVPIRDLLPRQTSEPPVIAFLGRLVTTKGVATLLAAAAILHREKSQFTCLIVGDGPQRPALEALVKSEHLDATVRFTGRLGASELDAALGGVSIVVVPSLGGEVFGLVVAENMLRGLPVVTSDLGAFVEVLGDAGFTFEAGQPAVLAAQLARLLDDPVLRATLGQRARQRAAELCDFQRMLEAHARVYREVGGAGGSVTGPP
jgi:glycosyltransferase involved in cell wall biosynthesis